MQISVLLLPLLGGYLFCHTCEWYKYSLDRRTGYDLFFMSAIAGFVLWLPSVLITSSVALLLYAVFRVAEGLGLWNIAEFVLWPPSISLSSATAFVYVVSEIAEDMDLFVALRAANFLACICACVFGKPLGESLNVGRNAINQEAGSQNRPYVSGVRFIADRLAHFGYRYAGVPSARTLVGGIESSEVAERQIREEGDELEKLLRKSFHDEKLLMVTLEDRKVFIGFTTENADPYGDRRYFRILKILSGYRTEKREVQTMTNYVSALREIDAVRSDGSISRKKASDFLVVIAKDRVLYANVFDPRMAGQFDNPPDAKSLASALEEGQLIAPQTSPLHTPEAFRPS